MRHPSLNRTPSVRNPLEHADVDIWSAQLQHSVDMQALRCVLSADERRRAGRFRLEHDALQFTFGRAMLRRVLASYTGIPAECISFVYGAAGKPALADQSACSDIRFNLSHCAGLVSCIVARGRDVGIDVEQIDEALPSIAVAELFFSVNEKSRLRAAPAGCAAEIFFSCWTRKEAYVKARGVGAALILPDLDLPPPPVSSLQCGGAEWTLISFTPALGFIASVAVEGSKVHLRSFEYPMPKAGFCETPKEVGGNRTIHAGS